MRTEVLLVAGPDDCGVAEEVWRAWHGSVLVRHDLRGLADGVVRRWVDAEVETVELAHGCVSCTLRLDLIPLLERVGGRAVVALDPALDLEHVCLALDEAGIAVAGVVAVVDARTWLADATGDETMAERGLAAADTDERTVAQVVVGQAEFADAVVVDGTADPVLDAVLDRLNPLAPRRARSGLDVAELLAAVPADARRGRVDDGFDPLVCGRPPLGSAHGVCVVRLAESKPFHPMRLHLAFDCLLEDVVRVKGRVWVVSRPEAALWVESAGGGLVVHDLGPWPAPGDRAQEVFAITTTPAAAERVTGALRAALATDEELALADELEFVDPFAEWCDEAESC